MTSTEPALPWGSLVAAIGGGAGAAAIGRLVADQQILTAQRVRVGLALGGTALALAADGTARVVGTSIAAVAVGQLVLDLVEQSSRKTEGQTHNTRDVVANVSSLDVDRNRTQPTSNAATPMPNDDARGEGAARFADATWRNDWRSDVKITENGDGKVTFAGWQTHDDLYLAQWNYFGRVRGSDHLANDIIPRTTNGDVLQLVDFWQTALDEHNDYGSRAGMVNWDAAIAKWRTTTANATRDAQGHDVRATYAHNAELWDALTDLSEQLTIGAHAPTKTERLADAAKHAIVELPAHVAQGARVVANGTARAAKDVASAVGGAGAALLGSFFGPLQWPLLIVGGVVTVYLLTRSSKHTEETP